MGYKRYLHIFDILTFFRSIWGVKVHILAIFDKFCPFSSVFEKNKKLRRAESRVLEIPKIGIDNLWGSVSKRYL